MLVEIERLVIHEARSWWQPSETPETAILRSSPRR
jgi:hypothetical protein